GDLLIVKRAIFIHYSHDHWSRGVLRIHFTQRFERRQQTIDSDRSASGWNFLADKPLDQVIVPPATRDGAKLPLFSRLIRHFKSQRCFKDGTRIVGKTSNNCRVE